MKLLDYTKSVYAKITKYDSLCNTESFEAQLKYADIWDNAYLDLKHIYKLGNIRLTGEGFEMGKATATECIHTARIVRKETRKDVFFYQDSEYNLFEFLDDELIRLMEPEVKKLVSFYDKYCAQYVKINNLQST